MKKIILILFLCASGLSLLAQGIIFREGSWKEILAAAKKEKKLVFVDNYTSWCGPCKKMAKEIFPMKEVGDFYNTHFICYKLDDEKGDGVEVAKTYRIFSFPTYLYVDGNGKLYYRSGGYMPVEKFIAEGKVALEEFADKRSIEEWDQLYQRKKKQADFVRAYLEKRDRIQLDNADVLDQYVQVEKEKNLLAADFLKRLADFGTQVKAGGACCEFVFRHWKEIASAAGIDDNQLAGVLEYNIVRYSYDKAVERKEAGLLEEVLKVNMRLCEKSGKHAPDEEVKMRSAYAAATGDVEGLELIAEQHADILFREEKEVLERDAKQYMKYLEEMIAQPDNLASMQPDQLAFSLKFAAVNESSTLSFAFRDLAANVARLSDNRELLVKAMVWALEGLTLFDNFTHDETLAEILFKLGYQKEALREMQKAADRMPVGNDAIADRIKEKLNKIQNAL